MRRRYFFADIVFVARRLQEGFAPGAFAGGCRGEMFAGFFRRMIFANFLRNSGAST